ncbi:hypothetical protein C0J52_19303, partial [Blattella germanica]
GDTATCLYNSPHEDESLPRVLPGKLLTLDAQCRKDRGTSACFKDDRVCAQLFCFDAGSGYCVAYRPAAEGSPCGDGQYCLNGRCVAEHENIIPDYSQNTPAYLRRNDADSAATQTRPIYARLPNATSQRLPEDESWRSTTTPIPNKFLNNYYNNNNKENSYYSTPSTTLNPYAFNQYVTQSTTTNPYFTTKSPFSFNQFHSQTTTKNPYDFSNNRYTTRDKNTAASTIQEVNNQFNRQGTTRNPYDFANLDHYTKPKKPDNEDPNTNKFSHSHYNQYYSSSTTKNPYAGFNFQSTTLRPAFSHNINVFNAFSTPSTTTRKIPPNYFSSATQNSPSIISNVKIQAPIYGAGDTDECVDKVTNISGSMTCREFLTHYGFQYCSYQYMYRNCCASQRAVCARR